MTKPTPDEAFAQFENAKNEIDWRKAAEETAKAVHEYIEAGIDPTTDPDKKNLREAVDLVRTTFPNKAKGNATHSQAMVDLSVEKFANEHRNKAGDDEKSAEFSKKNSDEASERYVNAACQSMIAAAAFEHWAKSTSPNSSSAYLDAAVCFENAAFWLTKAAGKEGKSPHELAEKKTEHTVAARLYGWAALMYDEAGGHTDEKNRCDKSKEEQEKEAAK